MVGPNKEGKVLTGCSSSRQSLPSSHTSCQATREPGRRRDLRLSMMLTVHSHVTFLAPCSRKMVTICRHAATNVCRGFVSVTPGIPVAVHFMIERQNHRITECLDCIGVGPPVSVVLPTGDARQRNIPRIDLYQRHRPVLRRRGSEVDLERFEPSIVVRYDVRLPADRPARTGPRQRTSQARLARTRQDNALGRLECDPVDRRWPGSGSSPPWQ